MRAHGAVYAVTLLSVAAESPGLSTAETAAGDEVVEALGAQAAEIARDPPHRTDVLCAGGRETRSRRDTSQERPAAASGLDKRLLK